MTDVCVDMWMREKFEKASWYSNTRIATILFCFPVVLIESLAFGYPRCIIFLSAGESLKNCNWKYVTKRNQETSMIFRLTQAGHVYPMQGVD